MLLGCARAFASSPPSAGIIGGQPAAAGAWPWQISLGVRGMDALAGHFCGGVLVGVRQAVTAAHCVINSSGRPVDPATLSLTLGTSDLQSGGMTAGVTSIVVNPGFNQARFDNDIAVLNLDRDAVCAQCNPIALVTPATEPILAPPGTQATVTGWGVTVVGATTVPAQLQQVQVPIVDNGSCAAAYGSGTITAQMICAGTGGKDSCQGDSGGPLVVPNNEGTGFLLAGLVSFGQGCANAGYPGVYTRAADFAGWVSGAARGSTGGGNSGGGGDGVSLLLAMCMAGLLRTASGWRKHFRRARARVERLARRSD